MENIAIISEYNPFHNGHSYQIDKIRERFPDSKIISFMSGNFTQRGEIAVFSKWSRCKMALNCGVDMVIEIPCLWSIRSAQDFAFAGVYLAEKSGIIDKIYFSSECGNIDKLKALSKLISSTEVNGEIKKQLDLGSSYPSSIQVAVEKVDPEIANLLRYPNNLLAVEYLNALKKLNSKIEPYTIKRVGVGHDSKSINANFCSASFIRDNILANKLKSVENFVPSKVYEITTDEINEGNIPADSEYTDRMILHKLREMNTNYLKKIYGMSEGLENRILKNAMCSKTIDELLEKTKTKRYTYSKIKRLILMSILGLNYNIANIPPQFIRILGFRNNSKINLRELKSKAKLPVLANVSRDLNKFSEYGRMTFEFENKATNFYVCCLKNISNQNLEYTIPIVKI